MTNLTQRVQQAIRDVPDFPKKGILFKDITPILLDAQLSNDIVSALATQYSPHAVDAIVGVESRGFFFGFPLALALGVPFIPVRKQGKLPYETVSYAYDLEYGASVIEMHSDAVHKNMRVLIHDDLLATGGTAKAAAELVKNQGGRIAGFSFLVELGFLNGANKIAGYEAEVNSLVKF